MCVLSCCRRISDDREALGEGWTLCVIQVLCTCPRFAPDGDADDDADGDADGYGGASSAGGASVSIVSCAYDTSHTINVKMAHLDTTWHVYV